MFFERRKKMKEVSVTEAIEKAKRVIESWQKAEAKGKAYGFSPIHQRILADLENFKVELKKNKDNENYCSKTADGYVDVLQNALFHAKFNVKDKELKARLDKVHKELLLLIYILDGIDIVP
jgi:F0F1-type ATP synthase epsilon subunit